MKGHIRPRGKGTWAIVLDLGRDDKGKRRQKWHTVKGTKKDAEKELASLLHDMNTGTYVEPAKMTVGEYLQHWLDAYAAVNVTAKTYERYVGIVRGHLAPGLGQHPLPKLKPLHIQRFYAEALQSGRLNGKGGLSRQTVLHLHRIMHEALEQAVKWQLLARNPADAVDPPHPEHKEMRTLNEDQAYQLLEATKGSRYYMPILLAIMTGMRRGEILALRWEDIDLQGATVAVRRSLEQTKGKLTVKAPKTKGSRRVVTLPPQAVEALRHHKTEQAKERLLLGPAYQDNGLVCARVDGDFWRPDRLTQDFAKLVRKADVPAIRFHDLRHTHATLLLTKGVHPKVVSERLGHSKIGITMDTYSHVLPGMQEEAARKLGEVLERAASHKSSRG